MGGRRYIAGALVVGVLAAIVPLRAAVARPGDGDASFGVNGIDVQDLHVGEDAAVSSAVMPDGRIVVLRTAERALATSGAGPRWAVVVTRLLPSGAVDPSFGRGGSTELPVRLPSSLVADQSLTGVAVTAAGTVTVTGMAFGASGNLELWAVRVLSTGVIDVTYGDPGTPYRTVLDPVEVPGTVNGPTTMLGPAGDPILTFTEATANGDFERVVFRVEPTLQLDARYGGDGRVAYPEPLGSGDQLDASGRWLAARVAEQVVEGGPSRQIAYVRRTLADGTPDATFGTAGLVSVDVTGRLSPADAAIRPVGSGLVVVTPDGLLRLDGQGHVVTSFGSGGVGATGGFAGAPSVAMVAGDVTVASILQGPAACVTVRRYNATTGLPVGTWGSQGTAVVCPRRGINTLVGTAASGGHLQLLTTSAGAEGADRTATVSQLADNGSLDPAFAGVGHVDLRSADFGGDRAVELRVLPDGRLRAAVNSADGPGVLQLMADGRPDGTVGTNGVALTTAGPSTVSTMALLPDGGTVLGGDTGIVALDASGHLETGFGSGGFVATAHPVHDLAVVGNRILALDEGPPLIMVLGTDGAPDPAYLAQIHLPWDVTPLGVENRGDGFIVVGEHNDGTDVVGGFLASGASDTSFGSGGLTPFAAALISTIFGEPVRVAYGPLGRIFIAVNGTIVALDAAGHLDTTFAPGDPGGAAVVLGSRPPLICGVCGMTVDSAGRILVTRGGALAIWIERLLPTGALDPTFGDQGVRLVGQEGLFLSPHDLRMDPQGRLMALATADHFGDASDTFGAASDIALARLDPSAPSPLPRVLVDPATVTEGQFGTVHVHLDQASSVPVVVKLDVVLDGTATAADVGTFSSPVWLYPGQTAIDVILPIVDDHVVEGDETFDVQVTAAYQATGEGTRSTVTIVDNDRVATVFGRVAGADRYETASLLSQKTFSPGVGVAYVATGENYPDALAAAPAAINGGGPVLLSQATALPAATRSELSRLKPNNIVVLGGSASLSPDVQTTLQQYTTGSVTRLQGADRYATAAAVSAAVFAPGVDTVYVASGEGFADALAGGPAAGLSPSGGGPLLLVQKDALPAATRTELQRLGAQHIVVLGGPSAVSDDVVAALGPFSAQGVMRRAGADRYLTAVEVSKASFATASEVFLATGVTFPDALSAGPAGGAVNGPLLLTRPDCIPPAVDAEINRLHPSLVVVLGGSSTLSDAVANRSICAPPAGP